MVKKYIEGESKEQRKRRKALEKMAKLDQPTFTNEEKYYIVCLKHGTLYSADYVNRLYNMVKRNCTLDYEFVCLTDDPKGINSNVKILPLPGGIAGWWCKPYMFSKDLPLNGTVLYMDLDVVISGNLNKLFEYETDDWCVIRDFTRAMQPKWEKNNSSVIRFKLGQLNHVWTDFIKDPNIHGVIFPSILGITYDKQRRDELIDLALANNTDLLFVDERILLNNDKERKYLDKIFEYINDEEDPDLLLGHTR